MEANAIRFHPQRSKASLIALLLTTLLWAPNAGARFCRGEQERVRIFANYLGRSIDTHIGTVVFDLGRLARSLADELPGLGLKMLHLQARDSLARMLEQAADKKGNFPSLEDIRSSMQPSWDRAILLQREVLNSNAEFETQLSGILKEVLLNWAACKSLSSLDPAYCEILKSVDISKRSDCRSNLVRLGVLFAGNCKGDLMDFAAETLNYSRSEIETGCEILAKRQANRCKLFGEFEFKCLALCRGDENACRGKELTEKQVSECLRDLLEFDTIHGKRSMADFLKKNTNVFSRFGVLALLGSDNCVASALERYDQLIDVPFQPSNR